MAKLLCVQLEESMLVSTTYTTPKGNTHLFQKGAPTDIPDTDDVAFFLRCGGGKLFRQMGVIEKVKETVKDIIPKKEKKYTELELKQMNRADQIALIKKLGGDAAKIPSKEADKIKLILELQG